jgi:hypothetical protein
MVVGSKEGAWAFGGSFGEIQGLQFTSPAPLLMGLVVAIEVSVSVSGEKGRVPVSHGEKVVL